MTPYLSILKLVWPLALGMVNNALMQFTDRAFLAHESMTSLEAILPASMLVWIFLSFFQSAIAYSGVFVAQYHGAKNAAACVRCYRAAVLLSVVSGLVLFALLPVGGFIFSLSAPAAELLAREKSYYDICLSGGFFLLGQMAAASYFTGLGRTRIVFWVNLLGNVLNVALDPVLIFGLCGFPRLGIAGAAYATVASMFLQWAVLTWAAHRAVRGISAPGGLWGIAWKILRLGIPSGGYAVLNTLSFTVFVFITGRVGDVAFAASNACFTVNYLLFAPMEGFALGAQTLVGQACGRGDVGDASRAVRRTLILALSFIGVVSTLVLICHRPILALFAPQDMAAADEFMRMGRLLFFLMATWLLFDAVDVVLSGALKGAGDAHFVFWWMLIAAFVIWLPLVFVVAQLRNTMPALWATMIAYVVVISVGSYLRWRRGKWKSYDLMSGTKRRGVER